MAPDREGIAPTALDRARWLNFAQTALFSLAMGLAIPVFFQHTEVTFRASAGTVGLIAALFGGVQVAVRLPLGALIDRRGETGVLLASWALTLAGGVVLLAGRSLVTASAGFLLFGLAVGAFWVGSNTLATRLAPPGGLGRAMQRYMVATGVGFLLGPLLGATAALIGFAGALGLLAPIAVVGAALVLVLPTPPVSYRGAVQAGRDATGRRLGIATGLLFGAIVGTADAFVPVHLALVGVGALGVGLFVSAREAVNLVVRLVAARWAREGTAHRLLAVGALAMLAGSLLFPRVTGPVAWGMAAALMGVGIGLWAPASMTLTAESSRPGGSGRAMGAWGTALGIGLLAGPALLGPVGQVLGLVRVFDGLALVSLVGAVLAVLHRVGPSRRRG